MMIKLILLPLIFAAAALPSGRSPANFFDRKTQIGLADFRSDRSPCLIIENDKLVPNGPIFLVFPSVKPRVQSAVVDEKLATNCSADQAAPEGASFYTLKVIGASPSPGEVAVALSGTPKPTRSKRGTISVDLDGNGRREYFRACTSREGVHLTVWSGRPLTGERIWHSYYYLGYDVEPSCRDKETALSQ